MPSSAPFARRWAHSGPPGPTPQAVGGALANSFIQMSAQQQSSLQYQDISVSASASASYGTSRAPTVVSGADPHAAKRRCLRGAPPVQ